MRDRTTKGRAAVIAAVWIGGHLWSADRAAAAAIEHVRSEDAFVRDLLRTGYERSATFRALVDEIDAGPLIVYIERVVKLSRGMEGALLHVAAGSSPIRMLRILLKTSLAGDYAIGVLAHELQHVVEVMRGGPVDGKSIANTFATHDDGASDAKFETPEARAIGERVLEELRARTRR